MINYPLWLIISKIILYFGLIKEYPCEYYPHGILYYIDYKPNKYIHIKQ